MNGTEERVRQALHQAADGVHPDEFGSLDVIRSRGRAAKRRRAAVLGGVSVVFVGAVVAAALAFDGDRNVSVEIPPAGSTSTTSVSSTTTTSVTPTTVAAPNVPPAIFPTTPRFTDPREAAIAFVTEYLAFPRPRRTSSARPASWRPR